MQSAFALLPDLFNKIKFDLKIFIENHDINW